MAHFTDLLNLPTLLKHMEKKIIMDEDGKAWVLLDVEGSVVTNGHNN